VLVINALQRGGRTGCCVGGMFTDEWGRGDPIGCAGDAKQQRISHLMLCAHNRTVLGSATKMRKTLPPFNEHSCEPAGSGTAIRHGGWQPTIVRRGERARQL
jgi:hypothetical protein